MLRPLQIIVPKETNILDYKIRKESRPVVNSKLKLSKDQKYLTLSFDIMEKNDGVTIQLIYTGSINPKFKVDSVVEGVEKLKDAASEKNTPLLLHSLKLLFFVFMPSLLLVSLNRFVIRPYLIKLLKYITNDNITNSKIYKYASTVLMIIILIITTTLMVYKISERAIEDNPRLIIPQEILPE